MSNLVLAEKQELPTTELVSIAFLDMDSLPQDMSKEQARELIKEVEEILRLAPQVELPVKHHFGYKVYGRELHIPKGTFIVGKIHKFQTMNILSAGEVSVFSIDGVMRLKALYTFVSSPGAKRLIYAHEDSVWTTFHGTEETDVDKILEYFVANDYSEVEEIEFEIVGRPVPLEIEGKQ